MEWKPFETAPRDGTFFLAAYDRSHPEIEGVAPLPSLIASHKGRWISADERVIQWAEEMGEPTHWCELHKLPTFPQQGGWRFPDGIYEDALAREGSKPSRS